MTMGELVTIVVPVYNAIGYVARCMASLMKQTYRELQIIVVDDGSTDGSGDLCEELAKQDARVKVIHQPNAGVSAARNVGLSRAQGGWISFVDSDDYVSPHYIEDMLSAAGDSCDMAICRTAWVEEDSDNPEPFRRDAQTQRITGREACLRNFGKDIQIFIACWGKLFRAGLWDGLLFPEVKIGEDLFVSHSLLYRAKHIAITEARLYAYVQSQGSLMRSASTSNRLDKLDAWQEGVRFFSEAGDYELVHIARRVYCSRVFDAVCVCKKYIPQEREIISKLKSRGADAYRSAKPIRGYIDCSTRKAFAYRIKLFLGRWFRPLYAALFMRGRMYI